MFGLNSFGRIGAIVRSAFSLAPFSPLSLFASGEQGAWYDPSDLSTMFQDSAGTTPVTAVGQPVGLILDKSKGLELGSETVTNGTFDTDVSGWTGTNGASLSWSSGKCVATFSSAGDPTVSQIITQPAGHSLCTLTFTCNYTGASRYYFAVGADYIMGDITSGQTVSLSFYSYNATSSVKYIEVRTAFGAATGTFTIDDVSVKLVNGNHASQATAAARPLLVATGICDWTNYDAVDDVLNTTFPSALGSSCTVARANVGAAPTILTAQTIGTSYADSTDNAGLIIVNRALTGQETTDLTACLTAKGATA